MTKKQPAGIKLACLFIWIGAIVALVGSVVTVTAVSAASAVLNSALFGMVGTAFTAVGVAAGILGIVFALVMFLLGWALWKHYAIAWYIAFLVVFVQLVVVVGSMILTWTFTPMVFVSIALTGVFIYALLSKESIKICKVHLGDYKGHKGLTA